MGKEICEQEGRAKIMCFTHGNPIPKTFEYGNVKNEDHFVEMMAGALIIGHEDGTFVDKAIGYYNGVWYHSVPDEYDDEPIQKGIPIRCNACGSTDFSEYDMDTIICQECGNCQLLDDCKTDSFINQVRERVSICPICNGIDRENCEGCDGYGIIIDMKIEGDT